MPSVFWRGLYYKEPMNSNKRHPWVLESLHITWVPKIAWRKWARKSEKPTRKAYFQMPTSVVAMESNVKKEASRNQSQGLKRTMDKGIPQTLLKEKLPVLGHSYLLVVSNYYCVCCSWASCVSLLWKLMNVVPSLLPHFILTVGMRVKVGW